MTRSVPRRGGGNESLSQQGLDDMMSYALFFSPKAKKHFLLNTNYFLAIIRRIIQVSGYPNYYCEVLYFIEKGTRNLSHMGYIDMALPQCDSII